MIRFGYHMRAIVADSVILEASFYDKNMCLIETCRKEIAEDIASDFHDVCAEFPVIRNASFAKIAICFSGTITACTFGMPFLELYENA